MCLTQLQAIAAIGHGGRLVSNGTFVTVLKAFEKYLATAKIPSIQDAFAANLITPKGSYASSGPDYEAVQVFESFIQLCTFIFIQARSDISAADRAQYVAQLISFLPRLPTPASLRLCLVSIEAQTRTESSQMNIMTRDAVQVVVQVASQLFGVNSNNAAERTNASNSGQATTTAFAKLNNVNRIGDMNIHLPPAFLLLDRISRNKDGLSILQTQNVVPQLVSSVDYTQKSLQNTEISALGVKILARIIGDDLVNLLAKLRNAAGSASAASQAEIDFITTLLASLTRDPDVVTKIVSGKLTESFVKLLDIYGNTNYSSRRVTNICLALRNVANQNVDSCSEITEAGALSRLITVVQNAANNNDLQTASYALSTLATLMSSTEELEALDNSAGCVKYVLDLLVKFGASNTAIAVGAFQFLHACQVVGLDNSQLVANGIISAALAALTSTETRAAENSEIQVNGLLVLIPCLSNSPSNAKQCFESGIIQLLLRHFAAAGSSNAGGFVSVETVATPQEEIGGLGSNIPMPPARLNRALQQIASLLDRPSFAHIFRNNRVHLPLSKMIIEKGWYYNPKANGDESLWGKNAFGRANSAQQIDLLLCALSLHILNILCRQSPEEVSQAKKNGMIKAMLGAYTRHRDNNTIHDIFTDVVEGTISAAEVETAVRQVAVHTIQLKDKSGDSALFSIAESDLGNEGVLLSDGTVAMASEEAGDIARHSNSSRKSRDAKAAGKAAQKSVESTPMNSASLGEAIIEDLCLLEAATNSARLSGILNSFGGIPTLIRSIAIVSTIKARAEQGNKPVEGGMNRVKELAQQQESKLKGLQEGFTESNQEELLLRAVSTITGLCRINIDSKHGVPGMDPIPTSISDQSGNIIQGDSSASAFGASSRSRPEDSATARKAGHRRQRSGKTVGTDLETIRFSIGEALYRPVVYRVLIKLINTRPNLLGAVGTTCIALGVLSLGTMGATFSPLEAIVKLGGIEAIVGAMRSHSNSLAFLHAACIGVGCIAVAERDVHPAKGTLTLPAPNETIGSQAVVSRGVTRQILRELQTAASSTHYAINSRWHGPIGQTVLSSLLRVLLVIAETNKGIEVLKKQGAVDALISTIDTLQYTPGTLVSTNRRSGKNEGKAHDAGEKTQETESPDVQTDEADNQRGGAGGTNSPAITGAGAAAMKSGGNLFSDLLFMLTDTSTASNNANRMNKTQTDSTVSASLSGESSAAVPLGLATSILSKLMDGKDLSEAIEYVETTATKMQQRAVKGTGTITMCSVAITTIHALSTAENTNDIPRDVWERAFQAVASLLDGMQSHVVHSAQASNPAGSSANDLQAYTQKNIAFIATEILLSPAIKCLASILKRKDLFPTTLNLTTDVGAISLNGNLTSPATIGRLNETTQKSTEVLLCFLQLGSQLYPFKADIEVSAKEKCMDVTRASSMLALETIIALLSVNMNIAMKAAKDVQNQDGMLCTVLRILSDSVTAGECITTAVCMQILYAISQMGSKKTSTAAKSSSGQQKNVNIEKNEDSISGADALFDASKKVGFLLLELLHAATQSLVSSYAAESKVAMSLLLLKSVAASSDARAKQYRTLGGLDLARSAFQQYCDIFYANDTTEGVGNGTSNKRAQDASYVSANGENSLTFQQSTRTSHEDIIASGAAFLLQGVAALTMVLAGRDANSTNGAANPNNDVENSTGTKISPITAKGSPEKGSPEQVLTLRILALIRREITGTYILRAPKTMAAIANLWTVLCSPTDSEEKGTETKEDHKRRPADAYGSNRNEPTKVGVEHSLVPAGHRIANKDALSMAKELLSLDARAVLVAAMSSTMADSTLLSACAQTLTALGLDVWTGTVTNVRKAVGNLRKHVNLPQYTDWLSKSDFMSKLTVVGDDEGDGIKDPDTTLDAETNGNAAKDPEMQKRDALNRQIECPLRLIRQLDHELRECTATLSTDAQSGVTPLCYRFVFDTIAGVVDTTTQLQRMEKKKMLHAYFEDAPKEVLLMQAAAKGSASTSSTLESISNGSSIGEDMEATPKRKKRSYLSASLSITESPLVDPAAITSPTTPAAVVANEGQVSAQSSATSGNANGEPVDGQADYRQLRKRRRHFVRYCSTIISNALQAISRLSDVAVVPNFNSPLLHTLQANGMSTMSAGSSVASPNPNFNFQESAQSNQSSDTTGSVNGSGDNSPTTAASSPSKNGKKNRNRKSRRNNSAMLSNPPSPTVAAADNQLPTDSVNALDATAFQPNTAVLSAMSKLQDPEMLATMWSMNTSEIGVFGNAIGTYSEKIMQHIAETDTEYKQLCLTTLPPPVSMRDIVAVIMMALHQVPLSEDQVKSMEILSITTAASSAESNSSASSAQKELTSLSVETDDLVSMQSSGENSSQLGTIHPDSLLVHSIQVSNEVAQACAKLMQIFCYDLSSDVRIVKTPIAAPIVSTGSSGSASLSVHSHSNMGFSRELSEKLSFSTTDLPNGEQEDENMSDPFKYPRAQRRKEKGFRRHTAQYAARVEKRKFLRAIATNGLLQALVVTILKNKGYALQENTPSASSNNNVQHERSESNVSVASEASLSSPVTHGSASSQPSKRSKNASRVTFSIPAAQAHSPVNGGSNSDSPMHWTLSTFDCSLPELPVGLEIGETGANALYQSLMDVLQLFLQNDGDMLAVFAEEHIAMAYAAKEKGNGPPDASTGYMNPIDVVLQYLYAAEAVSRPSLEEIRSKINVQRANAGLPSIDDVLKQLSRTDSANAETVAPSDVSANKAEQIDTTTAKNKEEANNNFLASQRKRMQVTRDIFTLAVEQASNFATNNMLSNFMSLLVQQASTHSTLANNLVGSNMKKTSQQGATRPCHAPFFLRIVHHLSAILDLRARKAYQDTPNNSGPNSSLSSNDNVSENMATVMTTFTKKELTFHSTFSTSCVVLACLQQWNQASSAPTGILSSEFQGTKLGTVRDVLIHESWLNKTVIALCSLLKHAAGVVLDVPFATRVLYTSPEGTQRRRYQSFPSNNRRNATSSSNKSLDLPMCGIDEAAENGENSSPASGVINRPATPFATDTIPSPSTSQESNHNRAAKLHLSTVEHVSAPNLNPIPRGMSAIVGTSISNEVTPVASPILSELSNPSGGIQASDESASQERASMASGTVVETDASVTSAQASGSASIVETGSQASYAKEEVGTQASLPTVPEISETNAEGDHDDVVIMIKTTVAENEATSLVGAVAEYEPEMEEVEHYSIPCVFAYGINMQALVLLSSSLLKEVLDIYLSLYMKEGNSLKSLGTAASNQQASQRAGSTDASAIVEPVASAAAKPFSAVAANNIHYQHLLKTSESNKSHGTNGSADISVSASKSGKSASVSVGSEQARASNSEAGSEALVRSMSGEAASETGSTGMNAENAVLSSNLSASLSSQMESASTASKSTIEQGIPLEQLWAYHVEIFYPMSNSSNVTVASLDEKYETANLEAMNVVYAEAMFSVIRACFRQKVSNSIALTGLGLLYSMARTAPVPVQNASSKSPAAVASTEGTATIMEGQALTAEESSLNQGQMNNSAQSASTNEADTESPLPPGSRVYSNRELQCVLALAGAGLFHRALLTVLLHRTDFHCLETTAEILHIAAEAVANTAFDVSNATASNSTPESSQNKKALEEALKGKEAVSLKDIFSQSGIARYTGLTVAKGLDVGEEVMKSLQMSLVAIKHAYRNSIPKDCKDYVTFMRIKTLLTVLEDIYITRSSNGFLQILERTHTASAAAPEATQTITAKNVEKQSAESKKLFRCIEDMEDICLNLEADAIPIISQATIANLTAVLERHAADENLVRVVFLAFVRISDNAANHSSVLSSGVLRMAQIVSQRYIDDARICDSIVCLIRPYTASEANLSNLALKECIPMLAMILTKHMSSLTPKRRRPWETNMRNNDSMDKEALEQLEQQLLQDLASPRSGSNRPIGSIFMESESALRGNVVDDGKKGRKKSKMSRKSMQLSVAEVPTPVEEDSPSYPSLSISSISNLTSGLSNTASTSEMLAPVIAHSVIQCFANLACDITPESLSNIASVPGFEQGKHLIDAECSGCVARLVVSGGIQGITEAMTTHTDELRLLEDALCALSNMAYSSSSVRHEIGKVASAAITASLAQFASDPATFAMALRAIGNLTRSDENIIAMVAGGVTESVVRGMEMNKDKVEILILSADVLGNLSSLDEAAVNRAEAIRVLTKGIAKKNELGKPITVQPPAEKPTKSNATHAANDPSSISSCLVQWIIDEGGDKALLNALRDHPDDATLVAAAIRALSYLCESETAVERIRKAVPLAATVSRVMNSCDYDPLVSARGAAVCQKLLNTKNPQLVTEALENGIHTALLSALETHSKTRVGIEACSAVVVALLGTAGLDLSPSLLPELVKYSVSMQAPNSLLQSLTYAYSLVCSNPEMLAAIQEENERTTRVVTSGVNYIPVPTKDLAMVHIRNTLVLQSVWAKHPEMAPALGQNTLRAILQILHATPSTATTAQQFPQEQSPDQADEVAATDSEAEPEESNMDANAQENPEPNETILVESSAQAQELKNPSPAVSDATNGSWKDMKTLNPSDILSLSQSQFAPKFCKDPFFVEVCLKILSGMIKNHPEFASDALNNNIMSFVLPLMRQPGFVERMTLTVYLLSTLVYIAINSPSASLSLVDGGALSVCEYIATLWALRKKVQDSEKQSVYSFAGVVMKILLANSNVARSEVQWLSLQESTNVNASAQDNGMHVLLSQFVPSVPISSDGSFSVVQPGVSGHRNMAVPPSDMKQWRKLEESASQAVKQRIRAAQKIAFTMNAKQGVQFRSPDQVPLTSLAYSLPPADGTQAVPQRSIFAGTVFEQICKNVIFPDKSKRALDVPPVVPVPSYSTYLATIQPFPGLEAAAKQKVNISLESVLETRGGCVDWALFPQDTINQLAGVRSSSASANDAPPVHKQYNIWFVPHMFASPNAALTGAAEGVGVKMYMKKKEMFMFVTPDLHGVTWSYSSKRTGSNREWKIAFQNVTAVRVGVPFTQLPKPMLKFQSPDVGKSITLEGAKGPLLHIEARTMDEHDKLLRAFSILVSFSKLRKGSLLPSPLLDLLPLNFSLPQLNTTPVETYTSQLPSMAESSSFETMDVDGTGRASSLSPRASASPRQASSDAAEISENINLGGASIVGNGDANTVDGNAMNTSGSSLLSKVPIESSAAVAAMVGSSIGVAGVANAAGDDTPTGSISQNAVITATSMTTTPVPSAPNANTPNIETKRNSLAMGTPDSETVSDTNTELARQETTMDGVRGVQLSSELPYVVEAAGTGISISAASDISRTSASYARASASMAQEGASDAVTSPSARVAPIREVEAAAKDMEADTTAVEPSDTSFYSAISQQDGSDAVGSEHLSGKSVISHASGSIGTTEVSVEETVDGVANKDETTETVANSGISTASEGHASASTVVENDRGAIEDTSADVDKEGLRVSSTGSAGDLGASKSEGSVRSANDENEQGRGNAAVGSIATTDPPADNTPMSTTSGHNTPHSHSSVSVSVSTTSSIRSPLVTSTLQSGEKFVEIDGLEKRIIEPITENNAEDIPEVVEDMENAAELA